MVALQFLVLSVEVRIPVSQQQSRCSLNECRLFYVIAIEMLVLRKMTEQSARYQNALHVTTSYQQYILR